MCPTRKPRIASAGSPEDRPPPGTMTGGLMTYTTNYYDVFRRQGLFIDKIFKGVAD